MKQSSWVPSKTLERSKRVGERLSSVPLHQRDPNARCRTDVSEGIREYSQLQRAGDIVGLVEAPGKLAVIAAGHGWDSPVASTLGLFRLEVVRGVALSAAE